MSFKIIAEGFVSSKFNRENTIMIEGKPVTYINTSLGSKYVNPHTKAESWDNVRILLKGDIADSFKQNVQGRDLVRVEGNLHEKSYQNENGVTIRYMEATITSYRKLEIQKKLEKPQASDNPLAALSPEQLASFTPEQLKILAGTNA